MSSGDRFVQTLRKLSYPKAGKLDGDDFDWLFDTTDIKSFLDWFCTSATEQNVVSGEKLQAFNNLKESGKAVLDEKALEEVLKTCKVSNSKTSTMEEVAIGKLEEDLQSLQKLKNLYIGRRNKLQMIASSNSQLCLKFKDKEEEDAKALQESLRVLQLTNKKLNHELQRVVDGVQQLMAFFTIPEGGHEFSSHPIFLSQIILDKYLSCEEQSTSALTSFTKEHFSEGLFKFMEDCDEDFQLVQLSANKPLSDDDDLEDKSKEMMKLQLAYICAKHKLIQVKTKNASLKAGLQWAEENVMQGRISHNEENLKARISSLKNETSQIQNHIDVINRETLPDLVRESAQLLNMPVVKGDYDLQMARQNLYSSRQDQVCNHLLKQKASFELLHLGYELELRKHRDIYRQLESIIQDLKESSDKLEERLTMLSDPNLVSSSIPRSNIESKDSATHRLYELLDGDKMQKLFRTYDDLALVAQKLSQDITTLKNQLAVSEQEQALFMSKLDADMKSLHEYMYSDGSALLLNTRELSGQFHQLDSQLEKLNRIILEVLGDMQSKRKILESNKLQKMDKELYAYFFRNEDRLKKIVEDLEFQTDIHPAT
ncbi:HAUS augmin-like complex subunit 3 [Rhinophrynus dorsalis]